MEVEEARERPYGIEYLSVHCDIWQLVICSPSEAQKVPVRRFLRVQTANSNWNSLWERSLPDFTWRPVQGGLFYAADMRPTGHAADRANTQKQTVRSNWRGRSRTRKIEDEASQKN